MRFKKRRYGVWIYVMDLLSSEPPSSPSFLDSSISTHPRPTNECRQGRAACRAHRSIFRACEAWRRGDVRRTYNVHTCGRYSYIHSIPTSMLVVKHPCDPFVPFPAPPQLPPVLVCCEPYVCVVFPAAFCKACLSVTGVESGILSPIAKRLAAAHASLSPPLPSSSPPPQPPRSKQRHRPTWIWGCWSF